MILEAATAAFADAQARVADANARRAALDFQLASLREYLTKPKVAEGDKARVKSVLASLEPES